MRNIYVQFNFFQGFVSSSVPQLPPSVLPVNGPSPDEHSETAQGWREASKTWGSKHTLGGAGQGNGIRDLSHFTSEKRGTNVLNKEKPVS